MPFFEWFAEFIGNMIMKILLLYSVTDVTGDGRPRIDLFTLHFGLSYVSAVLRKAGHETRLVVMSEACATASRYEQLDKAVAELRPDVIGFTAVATQYPFMQRTLQHVRTLCPNAFTVIGGPHVTLNPDDAIKDGFDAVCIGEGEQATVELADQLARGQCPGGIANLWIHRPDGTVERNATRPFLADLDDLPFPDRDMWHAWISEDQWKMQILLLGRGCPFDCTHCCNHALRGVASGRYVRLRSPASVVAELRHLYMRYPERREAYLEVETIGVDKNYTQRLCDALEQFNQECDKPFTYGTNLRVSSQVLEPLLYQALKRANFSSLNIGLESGSERVRREILNRKYTNDEFLDVVRLARAHGLQVHLYNMIGLPTETPAEHDETVLLNRLVQPEIAFTSIFFPYPGTRLNTMCREKGLLETFTLDVPLERRRAVLDMPQFKRKEVENAYIWFEYRVRRSTQSRWILLNKVFKTKSEMREMRWFWYIVWRISEWVEERSQKIRRTLHDFK